MKSRIDKTEYTFDKYTSGTMFWYKDGKYHRENDKPAVIYSNGDMSWLKNDKYHRENDKPAIIYNDGRLCWYIDGEFIRRSRI
jgi:outer membrane lipoprotein-sorting protein